MTMRTSNGPFPMCTTNTWESDGTDAALMTLHNSGTPSGFAKLPVPLIENAMRRATAKDLVRIKAILEAVPGATVR